MNEVTPTAVSNVAVAPAETPSKTWPRALLAGLLSLLFPGMGQLLNRQPRKASLLALVGYVLKILFVSTRLLFTFWTMVLCLLVGIAWILFAAVEACCTVTSLKSPEPSVPVPRLTYSFLVLALSGTVLVPYPDLKKDAGFAAFKVPSASMCPTICLGERLVADMHAYQSKSPQRGDLILLKHPTSNALFIKRVIGLPGDTVGPGSEGGILVSGRRFAAPGPCGGAPSSIEPPDPANYSAFKSAVVPEGTLFVVGDNLANSFDSRIPNFAPVTPDMVRGKPLYLYWSPVPQRIGCPLR